MNLPDNNHQTGSDQSSSPESALRPSRKDYALYFALRLALADLNPPDEVWRRIKQTLQQVTDLGSVPVSAGLPRHQG
jgi:hypothetical protein